MNPSNPHPFAAHFVLSIATVDLRDAVVVVVVVVVLVVTVVVMVVVVVVVVVVVTHKAW